MKCGVSFAMVNYVNEYHVSCGRIMNWMMKMWVGFSSKLNFR